jgi:hypothetical protein
MITNEDQIKRGKMFKKEVEFFKANQDELVVIFGGMVLAIKGEEILGAYNSTLEAFLETIKKHKLGSFMLISCEPKSNAYTVKPSFIELILV